MQITRVSVVVYRNLEDLVESLESANMLVYVSKRIRLQLQFSFFRLRVSYLLACSFSFLSSKNTYNRIHQRHFGPAWMLRSRIQDLFRG